MKYNILLVEDDIQIREIITDYFTEKSEGEIKIHTAKDGIEGSLLIYEREFDLVMLDVMMPGMDGFSLCRKIREKSITPIVFITAKGREEDVLYGYAVGCDDYIVKPFSLAELYAKTQALIKRAKGMVVSREIVCGNIRLDPAKFTVYVGQNFIPLAPKEYALLKYFMEHQNLVIDRDTLLTRIWGYDFYGTDRVVDNHIKKLRKALGDAGEQIKTVITKGYKITEG